MKTARAPIWVAALLLATGALLLGCGCKKRFRCTASASYAGRNITGKGSDFVEEPKAKKLALDNLCNDHCIDQDQTVDKAVRAKKGGPPADHVERINIIYNPPVKAVFEACVATCKAATANAAVKYVCELSGIL